MENKEAILSALAALALISSPFPVLADETAAALAIQIDNEGLKEILWKGENYVVPSKVRLMQRAVRDGDKTANALGAHLGNLADPAEGIVTADYAGAKLQCHGIQAARSLPEANPVISAKLIEFLPTNDVALQKKAVAAFGELKVREAVPPLIALLSHKQENVSRLAVLALGQIGDRSAILPILDLYNRPYKTMAICSIRETQDAALKSLIGDKTSRTRDEWRAYFAQAKS